MCIIYLLLLHCSAFCILPIRNTLISNGFNKIMFNIFEILDASILRQKCCEGCIDAAGRFAKSIDKWKHQLYWWNHLKLGETLGLYLKVELFKNCWYFTESRHFPGRADGGKALLAAQRLFGAGGRVLNLGREMARRWDCRRVGWVMVRQVATPFCQSSHFEPLRLNFFPL